MPPDAVPDYFGPRRHFPFRPCRPFPSRRLSSALRPRCVRTDSPCRPPTSCVWAVIAKSRRGGSVWADRLQLVLSWSGCERRMQKVFFLANNVIEGKTRNGESHRDSPYEHGTSPHTRLTLSVRRGTDRCRYFQNSTSLLAAAYHNRRHHAARMRNAMQQEACMSCPLRDR